MSQTPQAKPSSLTVYAIYNNKTGSYRYPSDSVSTTEVGKLYGSLSGVKKALLYMTRGRWPDDPKDLLIHEFEMEAQRFLSAEDVLNGIT